jgi:hypothetical protein
MIRRAVRREALYPRSSREVKPQTGVSGWVHGRYNCHHCDQSDQAGHSVVLGVGVGVGVGFGVDVSGWWGWHKLVIAKWGCHAASLPSAVVCLMAGVGWGW